MKIGDYVRVEMPARTRRNGKSYSKVCLVVSLSPYALKCIPKYNTTTKWFQRVYCTKIEARE